MGGQVVNLQAARSSMPQVGGVPGSDQPQSIFASYTCLQLAPACCNLLDLVTVRMCSPLHSTCCAVAKRNPSNHLYMMYLQQVCCLLRHRDAHELLLLCHSTLVLLAVHVLLEAVAIRADSSSVFCELSHLPMLCMSRARLELAPPHSFTVEPHVCPRMAMVLLHVNDEGDCPGLGACLFVFVTNGAPKASEPLVCDLTGGIGPVIGGQPVLLCGG